MVGAVALVATGVGALATAGAFGAAAAAGGTVALGMTAATFTTIGALAGLAGGALSLAAGLTAKKPSQSIAGDQTKFTANKDQGIPLALGRTAAAGWIVHRQTYDTPASTNNAYQTLWAVWSGGGPIEGLEAFQVDGVTVNFVGDVAQGAYNGHMYMRWQPGWSPEGAALISTGTVPYPSGWSAASKMSGYAAYSWTLVWDGSGKKFPSGIPEPRGVIRGTKVYDPRKDSTYPGGSGAHRSDNPGTWEWTENGALLALAWARGLYQNGKRVLGIGFALGSINVPAYVEAANIADANEWTCGGIVYSTDGKWDVLKKILATCAGEPLQIGGQLSCLVSAPRVPLAVVRTSDIVMDGDWSVNNTPRSKERINGVIPKYRSEAHGWELVDAEEVRIPEYATADGRPRTKSLTWELVQDVDQVAELALYEIVNAREFGPIVTPLRIEWLGYRPGDCLTIQSPEIGLEDQDVIIRRRGLDPATGGVTMTSWSETYAKHAFALGQTGTPPPTPSPQVVDRENLLIPGYTAGWTGVIDDDPANHPRPEDGATVGGTLGVNIKRPDGSLMFPEEVLNSAIDLKPDGHLVATIDGVEQSLGFIRLPDLGAASDAARAQLDRDLASISEAVARLAAGQAKVNAVFRDAGLYVDPASGIAKLFAIESRAERIASLSVTLNAAVASINLKASVDYVDEQIALAVIDPSQVASLSGILVRLTSAEVDIAGLEATVLLKADATTVAALSANVSSVQTSLDALAATITTKASQTEVDDHEARLSTAESTISAMDGGTISQAVSASRRAQEDREAAGIAALNALALADRLARSTQTSIASARQDLSAKIIDGFTAEASLRLQLAVQIAAASASVSTETAARIAADGALAASLALYQAATDGSLATISSALVAQSGVNTSVAGILSSLSTTVGGHSATLTEHSSSIDGLKLRWGVELDNNGRVTGLVLNGTAERTDFEMVVDALKVVKAGHAPRTVFAIGDDGNTYILGKLTADSIETNMLKVNTAVVPVAAAASPGIVGTGRFDYHTVWSRTVNLARPGLVRCWGKFKQSFSATTAWGYRVLIDGVEVDSGGGFSTQDVVPLFGFNECDPGPILVEIQWGGNPTATFDSVSATADGLNNTSIA